MNKRPTLTFSSLNSKTRLPQVNRRNMAVVGIVFKSQSTCGVICSPVRKTKYESMSEGGGGFGILPVELHSLILGFLDVKDAALCSSVSKSWKQVARHDELWKHMFFKVFGEVASQIGLTPDQQNPMESTWLKLTQEAAHLPMIGSPFLPRSWGYYMNSSAFVAKVISTADFEFINPPTNLTGNATTPLETLIPAVPFVDLNDLEAGKPKLDPTFNYYGIYEDVTIGKEVICRWKGGNWWTGKVTAKHPTDDKWDVLYDDNTNDTNLGRAEFMVKWPANMLQKWRQNIREGMLDPVGLKVLINHNSNAIGPWPLDTIRVYNRHCWRLQVYMNANYTWSTAATIDDYYIRLSPDRQKDCPYDTTIDTSLCGKTVIVQPPGTNSWDVPHCFSTTMPSRLSDLYVVARFCPGETVESRNAASGENTVTIIYGGTTRRFNLKHPRFTDEKDPMIFSEAINKMLGLDKAHRLDSKEWHPNFIDKDEVTGKEDIWELHELEEDILERKRKEDSRRQREAPIQVLYKVAAPPGETNYSYRLFRREYIIPVKKLKKTAPVVNPLDRVMVKNQDKWVLGVVSSRTVNEDGLTFTVNLDDGNTATRTAKQVLLYSYVQTTIEAQAALNVKPS